MAIFLSLIHISLNVTQLEKQADKGEKTAQRLLRLTKEPSGFLSTIQIGITCLLYTSRCV